MLNKIKIVCWFIEEHIYTCDSLFLCEFLRCWVFATQNICIGCVFVSTWFIEEHIYTCESLFLSFWGAEFLLHKIYVVNDGMMNIQEIADERKVVSATQQVS
jgi:hypothetical protein